MRLPILYVEDNETNSRLGIRVFEMTGELAVTHVNSGEAAMQLLSEKPFAALVLDLDLPGIGGLEVLQWLREEEIVIPTVVVTASVMQQERGSALSLGAVAFLEKPAKIVALRATVLEAARGGAPSPE